MGRRLRQRDVGRGARGGRRCAAALPPIAAEVLFYAAREAIRNAGALRPPGRRRAPLTSAPRRHRPGSGLEITIEDDGVGLAPSPGAPAGGAGQGLALTHAAGRGRRHARRGERAGSRIPAWRWPSRPRPWSRRALTAGSSAALPGSGRRGARGPAISLPPPRGPSSTRPAPGPRPRCPRPMARRRRRALGSPAPRVSPQR